MVKKRDFAHGEFSWVDLMTPDPAAARAFYAAVFGWTATSKPTEDDEPYIEFGLAGDPVAGLTVLSPAMQEAGMPPVWNSYINVQDIETTSDRAVGLGAAIIVPILTVAGVGRLAVIRDPQGACIALWEQGAHCGAARVREPGSLCWNELATHDIDGARDFYRALLGWELTDYPGLPSRYYVAKVGERDVGGLLQMTPAWGEVPPHWAVYFAVDDADAAFARARQAGGSARVEPFDTDVGRIAVLADPQGATFSVLQAAGSC